MIKLQTNTTIQRNT